MSRLTPSASSSQLAASPSSADLQAAAPGSQNSANSLRGRQVSALRQMLRLNSASPDTAAAATSSSSSSTPQWKVLVFDRVGQDLLAPVMNVKALREEGVTLHLYIMSERDPVPEVPAIYFCQPTEENLRRIGEDLRGGLYGSYYFNFISPIQRQRLEDLASAAVAAGVVNSVQKLYDQYVNFICLENEMFVLKHQSSSSLSYHALNKPGVTDGEMDSMLNQIVDSLFAACVTLGTIPIIRCPRGNAAEAVATRLDKKIRENLRDARNTLFVSDGIQAGQYSFYRPLLVILDRQFDLATPLHHTWTYQALAHDVLKYSLNRVTITESPPDAGPPAAAAQQRRKTTTRECDLDPTDLFWTGHRGLPFPSVAENIQEELEDYRSKEDDIKRMRHDMAGSDDAGDVAAGMMIADNTQRLTSAVSSLPALLEKKRLIDMHTSIATAILEQIKARRLDVFFELEEKVMAARGSQQQASALEARLLEVLEDEECGTPEDKMRMFIIHFLCSPSVADESVDKFATLLENAGCDMAALKYLKRWKSLQKMASGQGTMTSSTDYEGGTRTISMFGKLMTQGSSFVMEGVKNLVVEKHNLPVTKIVEELMEIRQGEHQDAFRYFDPKILRGNENVPRAKNPFQEAIVFMVGGGNYIEYQNLMDYASGGNAGGAGGGSGANNSMMSKASASSANLVAAAASAAAGGGGSSSNPKRIIYGCTTLVNANQMMQQLAELGHEM